MSDAGLDIVAIEAVLATRAEELRVKLQGKIAQNLSGDILNTRSGALLNSISTEVDDDGLGLTFIAESTGVPYAAILEYGGKTAAHEILATKAQALAFIVGGEQRFARRVQHPGSIFKAYRYIGSAFDALAGELTFGLKDAVLDALGAGD
jgi:phage gpG-like protein